MHTEAYKYDSMSHTHGVWEMFTTAYNEDRMFHHIHGVWMIYKF